MDIDLNHITQRLERFQFRSGASARADFFEMLASLVKDGKPLDAGIRELGDRFTAKRRPHAHMLVEWGRAMKSGKPFSEAIGPYVDETEALIIASTERSGDIHNGLVQAATLARSKAEMKAALLRELLGPVLKTLALVGMLIGFSTSIAPTLTRTIPSWAMTLTQRSLFSTSDAVRVWWPLGLALAVCAIVAVAWSIPRYTGRFRSLLDRFPPWSVAKVNYSSTFMLSLTCLIQSGVPIETAIRYIRERSNPYMREHLALMVGRLRAGIEQGEAMDTGLLGDRIADMVAIYSRTADFDSAVRSVGQSALKEGIKQVEQKSQTVGLLVTVLMGVMLTWCFAAIMGIGDAAKRAADGVGKPAEVRQMK